MPLYKLFASSVQDQAASLDVRDDGHITAMWGYLASDLDADGETQSFEVSFSGSSGFTSNDTNSSIFGGSTQFGLLTSGAANNVFSESVSGLSIPVANGERIWLHTTGTSATIRCCVWIHVEGGAERKPAPRRR